MLSADVECGHGQRTISPDAGADTGLGLVVDRKQFRLHMRAIFRFALGKGARST
jgi:hypothetical protein